MRKNEKRHMAGKKARPLTRRKTSLEAPIAAAPEERIPPGKYEANCIGYEIKPTFKGRRDIFIRFEIYGSKYSGIVLFMACTYPEGKVRERHKYFKQWTLAARRRPNRDESLNPDVFPGRMYKVLVRDTQRRHSDGTLMAECSQYSVVDSIIEPMTGGGKL